MALTKISGDILDSGVNVAGIVTATSFDGPFIAGAGNSGILAGIITATELDLNGNVDISGNLTVHGDQTTLNTTLREVELLRVDANSSEPAGIITQTDSGDILKLYDDSTEVFKVADGGVLTITGKGNIINGDPSDDFGLAIRNKSTSGFTTSEHIEGTTNRKLTPLMIRNAGATTNAETYLGFDAGNTSKAQWNIGIKKTGSLQGDFIFNTRTGSSESAERLRITSGGYLILKKAGSVGIHKNDTDGVLYIAGGNNTDVGGNINLFGSGHSELANHVRIRNSGTVALEINENGQVGIKSTLPSYSLDLGRASSTIRLVSENTGTAIRIGAGGGSNDITLIRVDGSNTSHDGGSNDSANGFSFKYMGSGDGNENRFTVLSDNQSGSQIKAITVLQDGKVGVGSEIPSDMLDVVGSGRFIKTSNNYVHVGSSNAGGAAIVLDGDSNGDGIGADYAYIEHDSSGDLNIVATNPADNSAIKFNTGDGGERLRITSDGKVKICHVDNTDPTEILHVVATAVNQDIARFTGANRDRGLVVSTAVSGATNDAVIKFNADSQNNVGQHVFLTDGNEKLRIKGEGITVTGEVAASQDYPNLRPRLDFNFAAEKKLDPRITYYRTGPASFVNELGEVVLVGANTPRFDHDPLTGESKGLLMEHFRVNFLAYSNFIGSYGSGNSWLYGVGTDVFSASSGSQLSTNPDGSSPAYHYAPSSSAGYHRFYGSVTLDQYDTSYVVSVFAKRVTEGSTSGLNRYLEIEVSGNFALNGAPTGHSGAHGMSSVTFDLQGDGAISSEATTTNGYVGSPKMEKFADGWWRLSYVFNPGTNDGSSSLSGNIWFGHPNSLANDDGNETGNGNPSFYLWGAMIERGGHLTSYIPNHGPENSTRGQEFAVIDEEDFTDFYNTSESSVLAVGTMQRPAADQGQLNIFHIGNDNEDGHGVFRENGTKDVWYHIRNNNTTPTGGDLNPYGFGDWDEGEEAKIAIAFKDGDQAISVNGGVGTASSTATVTSSYPTADITKMWIGSHGNGSFFEGTIKRIAYYPKLLTDNQLKTLTA